MTHVSTFPRSLSHGRRPDTTYNGSSLRRDRRQDGGRGSVNNIDNLDGPPVGLTTGRSGELVENADVGAGTLRRRSLERSKQSLQQDSQDRFKIVPDRAKDPRDRSRDARDPRDRSKDPRDPRDSARSSTLDRRLDYKPTCEELEERRARPLYGPRSQQTRRANGYSESSNDTDDAVWSNWEEPFRKFDLDLTRPLPSNGAWPASLWEAHTPRRESSVSSSLVGSLRGERGGGEDARMRDAAGQGRDVGVRGNGGFRGETGMRGDAKLRPDAGFRSDTGFTGETRLREDAGLRHDAHLKQVTSHMGSAPQHNRTVTEHHGSHERPLDQAERDYAGRMSKQRGYSSDSEDPLTWLEQQRNKLQMNRVTQKYPRTDQERMLVAELRESQKNLAAMKGEWPDVDENNNEAYELSGGKQRKVDRYSTLDSQSRGGMDKYSTLDSRGSSGSTRYNTVDSRTRGGYDRYSALDNNNQSADKYGTLDSRGSTTIEFSTLDRRGRPFDRGTSISRSFSFTSNGEGSGSRFQSLPRNSRFENQGKAGGGRYAFEEEVTKITARPAENGPRWQETNRFDSLSNRHHPARKAQSTAALNDEVGRGFYKDYSMRSSRSRDFKPVLDDSEITLQPIGIRHLEDFDQSLRLDRTERVRPLERSATLGRIPKSSMDSFRRGMAQLQTNTESGQHRGAGLHRERSFNVKPKAYTAKPGSYTAQPEPFVQQNGSSHHASGSSTLPIGSSSKRSGFSVIDQSWQDLQSKHNATKSSLSDTTRNSAFGNSQLGFSQRTAERTSQYQNNHQSLPRSRSTNVPVQFGPDNSHTSTSITRQFNASEIHRPIAISPTADPKYSNQSRMPPLRSSGVSNNTSAVELDGFMVEQAIPRSGGGQRGPDTPDGAIRQYLAQEEAMMTQQVATKQHGALNPDMMHYEADEARIRAANEADSRGSTTLPNQRGTVWRSEQTIQTEGYGQGGPGQQRPLMEMNTQGMQRGGVQQLGQNQMSGNNQNAAFQSQQQFNQAQQNVNLAQQNLAQQQLNYAVQQNVAQVQQNQYPEQPNTSRIQQQQYQVQEKVQNQYPAQQNVQQNMYAVQQNTLQHQQQHQYPVQLNTSQVQHQQHQVQQNAGNVQLNQRPAQQMTSQMQQSRYQVQQNSSQAQQPNQIPALQDFTQPPQINNPSLRQNAIQPQPQFARTVVDSNQHNSQRRNSLDELEPFLREFTDTSPVVSRPQVIQQRQTFTAGFQQQQQQQQGQSGFRSNTLPSQGNTRTVQFQQANTSSGGGFSPSGAQPVRVINVQRPQYAVTAQSGSQYDQQQGQSGGQARQQSTLINSNLDGGIDYQEPVAYKQAASAVPASSSPSSIRTNVFTQTADLSSSSAQTWGLNHQTNGPFKSSQQLSGSYAASQDASVPEMPIYAEVPRSSTNSQAQQAGTQSGVIQPQREQIVRTIASVGESVPAERGVNTMRIVTPCGFDSHNSGFQPPQQTIQIQQRYVPDGQSTISVMDDRNTSLTYGDVVVERDEMTAFKRAPQAQQRGGEQGLLGIAPERYYIQQQTTQMGQQGNGQNNSQWSGSVENSRITDGHQGQRGAGGQREESFSSSVNQSSTSEDVRSGIQQVTGYQTYELTPRKPQSLSSMDSNQSPHSLELETRFRGAVPYRSSPTDPSSPSVSVSADRSSGGSLGSSRDGVEAGQQGPYSVKFIRDTSIYWYKPQMAREHVINSLSTMRPGSFIIRDSSSYPGSFALAVKVAELPANVQKRGDTMEDLVRHFLIEPTPKGVRLKGYKSEPIFGSLAALVYQHTITPLSLPCKLLLPDIGANNIDGLMASPPNEVLNQGVVLYLHSMDTETLTGPEALERSASKFLSLGSTGTTIAQLTVTPQNIILTDNNRKWTGTDESTGRNINARIFGFVSRKLNNSASNECHLFAELEGGQNGEPSIVDFIAKTVQNYGLKQ